MNSLAGLRKRRVHPGVTSKEPRPTGHEPLPPVHYGAWSASPLPSPSKSKIHGAAHREKSARQATAIQCVRKRRTESPKIATTRWSWWPMATCKISPQQTDSEHIVQIGQSDDKVPTSPTAGPAGVESPIEPQSPVPSSPAGRRPKYGALFTLWHPIDPQGTPYIWWLVTMNICYLYNAWAVPLRATFPYQTPGNTPYWLATDFICDAFYLIDLVLIKPRLMYMCDGFWVHELTDTKKNYHRKFQFKMDALSLVPLEVLYCVWGPGGGGVALLRLPRLLRLQTFWDLHGTVDRVLSKAYSVRIGKTLAYIFYLIHVQACAYYTMSAYEGLGSNGWVYDGEGSAYIRCFYFATKTATSIGKNPKPEHEAQYIFMTIAWLIGVFVFALLIGQIRQIINMATRQQSEYRYMLDQSLRYLRRLNLPEELQKRVSSWFIFTWKHQGCFDESRILASLPLSLRRALSLRVHGAALAKSSLLSSASCERALLRELVLALRPVAYLPGDVVCRRGDVGHEMYIVNSGQLLVMSEDDQEVLATLHEGSVFGEISLLGIPGADRRTATVRSRGYSQLFALSKFELEDVLQQYPAAQAAMHARAEALICANAQRGKT